MAQSEQIFNLERLTELSSGGVAVVLFWGVFVFLILWLINRQIKSPRSVS